MTFTKLERIQIVSGTIDSIANNICKLIKDPTTGASKIVSDVIRSVIEKDPDFKKKLEVILLNGIKDVVYDLNGNKVILAQLLKNNRDLMVQLVYSLFSYVLLHKNIAKAPSRINNGSFLQTFISTLGEILNTPSIILKYSQDVGFPTINVKGQKGGGDEDVPSAVGSPASSTSLPSASAAAPAVDPATVAALAPALGGRGKLLSNFGKKMVKSIKNNIKNGVGTVVSSGKAMIDSAGLGKNSGNQDPYNCPPLFDGFDYNSSKSILEGLLTAEIPQHTSTFVDKIASGIEYSMAKSRGELIQVMIDNMGSAYNTINRSLGKEMNHILVYQLLAYEMNAFGEAIDRVIVSKREESKREEFDYRIVIQDKNNIRDICSNMEDIILKQLQQPHNNDNSGRVRVKTMGGKKRTTKRIMKKRTIKRFTSKSKSRRM
jgi:hypothetical protein